MLAYLSFVEKNTEKTKQQKLSDEYLIQRIF